MILLIDNYDSFSYNLVQLIGSITEEKIMISRNDELCLDEIKQLKPSHIILSPGPGRPSEAGICEALIREYYDKIPILGVCLGHQAICETFGAVITYAKQLMHGKQSRIKVDVECDLFQGMPDEILVARYHSLAADSKTLPKELKTIAQTHDDEIMAVRHIEYPVYGVQFHPESVLTKEGKSIMENFLLR